VATVAELVAAVLEDGEFDATEAQVLRWLNTRHKQMCARSGCYRKTVNLGPLVAGQVLYAVPAEVLEILEVRVGDYVYGKARHNDFAEGEQGWVWLSGPGGIAGRDDDEEGQQHLRIFPAPKSGVLPELGTDVVVYGKCQPPQLILGEDENIKITDDYVDALVSGAIATGMLRVESRPDLASTHEALFDAACSELRIATNKKFRGSGPAQIRVVGYNA
jgi:hypothetical protein